MEQKLKLITEENRRSNFMTLARIQPSFNVFIVNTIFLVLQKSMQCLLLTEKKLFIYATTIFV